MIWSLGARFDEASDQDHFVASAGLSFADSFTFELGVKLIAVVSCSQSEDHLCDFGSHPVVDGALLLETA